MNWDAVGAIGEIVGALAVVVSLIYLAIQIRSQARESNIAAMHELAEAYRSASLRLGEVDFIRIGGRSAEDFAEATQEERVVLIVTYLNLFRVLEEAFIQHEEGRLAERYWRGMEKQIRMLLGVPTVHIFLDMRRHMFDEAFQSYIENLDPLEWNLEVPPEQ